ncbi:MAG TPA: polysaccharide biosynthesis tyrosine autokinase [Actinomycetota bacterium]|nr:polysaccharide biosynthesis tyrosine autokinase [Actinomycetota bacterium]
MDGAAGARWTDPDGTFDLRDLFRTILLHRWSIALVTVLAAGLAALYSFTRTPVYTAKATVLVRPVLTSPLEGRPDEISMPTEIELVTSSAVAQLAGDLMGGRLPATELLRRVSVRNPAGTEILEISFSDPDPGVARQGAQAFTDAYLRFRSEQAAEAIQRYTTRLRTEIADLDAQIASINERLSSLAQGSTEWRTLSDQRTQLDASRLALQSQLVSISALSTDPGQVIQPAQRPSAPSSPDHVVNLALGVLVGLVGGVTFAYARERLTDRIAEPAVLERYLGAPTLGLIPKTPALRGSARLAILEDPRGPAAEAYRTLRTNLLAVSRKPPVKSLLITSADMGEGKSTTAANLAVALAQVGRSVVLISADLRFPRLHAFFGIPNEHGLGQVLQGTVPLSEALADTELPDLRVLPSGPAGAVEEPVELLESGRMREVIERCGEADLVLIDGPPILSMADSLVLAGMVDGVLLVIDARSATRATVAETRHQIGQVGGRVVGGVFNRVEPLTRRAAYTAYDYRRGLLYRLLLPEGEPEMATAAPTRPGDGQRRRREG